MQRRRAVCPHASGEGRRGKGEGGGGLTDEAVELVEEEEDAHNQADAVLVIRDASDVVALARPHRARRQADQCGRDEHEHCAPQSSRTPRAAANQPQQREHSNKQKGFKRSH